MIRIVRREIKRRSRERKKKGNGKRKGKQHVQIVS